MKKITLKNLNNKEKGFTIIELVISIFVLSLGVVGIFNALSIITILTADSADRLTATYLAQEGMEIVRNIRDTNWLKIDAAALGGSPYSWDNGLTSSGIPDHPTCNESNPCWADYKSVALIGGAGKLWLDSKGFYVYGPQDPGVETKFIRKIMVELVTDAGDGITEAHVLKVKVEVSWDRKATVLDERVLAGTCGKYNCITAEETLYNWYNTTILVNGVKINGPAGEISESDVTLLTNSETIQLTAVINPSNATHKGVTWAFTDINGMPASSCLTLSSTGSTALVTAPNSGSCTAYVTVKAVDGGAHWTIFFDFN